MATESHIKGNNKFNKMSTTTVPVRLNYNTNADIIERLNNEKAIYMEGHEVKIVNTWVDDDNRKKGVTIEPVGNYGFPIDVYLDDLKKGKEEIEIK